MFIRYNTKAHHTDEFDITNANMYDSREFLVVRRGQKFYVKLTFDKPFNPDEDTVRLIFQFGKKDKKLNYYK